jgi:hypothetical protein
MRTASPAHHAKRCLVHLESHALGSVVAFGVDGKLDEHERSDLRCEHRANRTRHDVDCETGAGGDAGTCKVDHLVGRAPSTGFATGDQAEGAGQHAHALRVRPVQSLDARIDGVEETAEHRIALRRGGLRAHHQAHVPYGICDRARPRTIPLGCSRHDIARRVNQRCCEWQLCDLGDREVHASSAASTDPVVTLTLSRYLRLP